VAKKYAPVVDAQVHQRRGVLNAGGRGPASPRREPGASPRGLIGGQAARSGYQLRGSPGHPTFKQSEAHHVRARAQSRPSRVTYATMSRGPARGAPRSPRRGDPCREGGVRSDPSDVDQRPRREDRRPFPEHPALRHPHRARPVSPRAASCTSGTRINAAPGGVPGLEPDDVAGAREAARTGSRT